MIENFFSELILIQAELWKYNGDALNGNYEKDIEFNCYKFADYSRVRDEMGLGIESSINIYFDINNIDLKKLTLNDRIIIDDSIYQITSMKKSQSLVDMNFYKLTLSFVESNES